ncbi:hypothetical protein GJ744_006235 [Endocarpon pusillum]|uniref:Uncharacterized protein n=1 Tax=Endocarpon pusillum TaxID=364733 RepID=A0A8H7AK57_9EURO|nr:hypothetical protein GJ744_006235 [Endocarpon pusillum]
MNAREEQDQAQLPIWLTPAIATPCAQPRKVNNIMCGKPSPSRIMSQHLGASDIQDAGCVPGACWHIRGSSTPTTSSLSQTTFQCTKTAREMGVAPIKSQILYLKAIITGEPEQTCSVRSTVA